MSQICREKQNIVHRAVLGDHLEVTIQKLNSNHYANNRININSIPLFLKETK